MDYEIDSDLEEVSELELMEDSSIRPYLFEPTRNSFILMTFGDHSDYNICTMTCLF